MEVLNIPPKIEKNVPEDLLSIFRKCLGIKDAYPFTHQAEAWKKALKEESLYLVAGTAAGKSLAALIPLIYRVAKGDSQKLVCMYPLRALLEDQQKLIKKITDLCGLKDEIGIIKGGMTRSEIIHALTKKIIIATPDAVYWCFRSKTKYNSLMMYALSYTDDFLIDEAHTITGLSSYNLKLFIERLNSFRNKYFNKPSCRVHVLTATPSKTVDKLAGSKDKIFGKSKVGTVEVEIKELRNRGRIEFWSQEINNLISCDFRRLIIVLNSAKKAHKIFHKTQQLNKKLPLKIGWIPGAVLVDSLHYLKKAYPNIAGKLEKYIQEQGFPIMQLIQKDNFNFSWNLNNWYDLFDIIKIDDTNFISKIENEYQAPKTKKEWEKCWQVIESELDEKIYKKLRIYWQNYKVKPEKDFIKNNPDIVPDQSVLFLIQWFKENGFKEVTTDLLKKKWQKHIRHPYIKQWNGTEIPVFLYTGGMSYYDRQGLVEAFNLPSIDKAILISTSAVEAGVDFDADLLLTECAEGEASSILQRFGRVGRKSDNKYLNKVILYAGGNTLGKLRESQKPEITREDFNSIIEKCLGETERLEKSIYIDALHSEITRQIGISGIKLISQHEFAESVMSDAEIDWGYSLRGSEAQVELTKTGVQRSVFSTLPLIKESELEFIDSPFVLVKADVSFDQLAERDWLYEVDICRKPVTKYALKLISFKNNYWQVIDGNKITEEYKDYIMLFYGRLSLVKKDLEDGVKGEIALLDKDKKSIILPSQWFLVAGKGVGDLSKRFFDLVDYYPKDIKRIDFDKFEIILDRELGACVELYYRAKNK